MGKAAARTRRDANENLIAMIMGSIIAVIGDFAYLSFKLPGYNERVKVLGTLTVGDVVQMGASNGLTLMGFAQGQSRIAPFSFGMLMTQLGTKVLFPSIGLPRYIMFDVDAQGRLIPVKFWE